VIPALDDPVRLEQGLVSLLENRPRDCEILVIDGFGYTDPYDLRDEVQFLPAPGNREDGPIDPVRCVQFALEHSRGEVVHVLTAGCEVEPHWVEAALRHFHDPRTALVAPLVFDLRDRSRVLSAGIVYHAGGCVTQRAQGAKRLHALASLKLNHAGPVLGCSLHAGFFRREPLLRTGGFPCALGESAAAAEIGLRMRKLGWKSIYEPDSQVFAPDAQLAAPPDEVTSGWQAECLFWRNLAAAGTFTGLCAHPLEIVRDLVTGHLGHAVGRLTAISEAARIRAYRRAFEQWQQTAVPPQVSSAVPQPHANFSAEPDAERVTSRRAG